ncbi:MAG: isoleucine--tRNA ligase, partial [Candidatus Tectomicrobia bacterium]|nr:isoleucine--tRNA ligase [Candidatus Tectomicrobia bacterium]
MFRKVNNNPDFPALERRIRQFWEETRAFEKLVEKNRGKNTFSFFDGPITANNPMGVHHAWGRTYKDIFQRFKAMQRYDQRYQNGFDCQGLWVEVEVEKDLGLNSKKDIVNYGLENFSRQCRERVMKYSSVQTEQSKLLGQWMDWDHSYYTMSDTNIEAIWHFLKKCYEKGWLYKGHRSMPWCIRCGTSLSQHELIDSYREMTHPSVYVKMPIKGRPDSYFLVWTTTPWTLAANTALAVHPDLDYVKASQNGSIFYLSSGTISALGSNYQILETVKGKELVGLEYEGPFHDLPALQGVQGRVVSWKDVSDAEGTGIVHIAPGCGAEDFELGKVENLPVIIPIDDNGFYVDQFDFLSGVNVAQSANLIFKELEKKGYLYKLIDYEHRYPVCWRCGEELVFKVVDEWFISCDQIRPLMIREARKVNWIPDYAGKRMEDWLNNMGDWCISRKRFWGLPLPFYPCSCGHFTLIGSKKELESLAIEGLDQIQELHRPWIDRVKIACPKCGKPVSRIEEVGDCWLDAGIIPFSTLGYLDEDQSYWKKWFPADFITEMREQIRLWFYSLLFMGVTLEETTPYKNVLVSEKLYDEQGRPMHKSWGNAIPFDEAAERMGADVMRWVYAQQNIAMNLRFGYGPAHETKRKMLTLWNVYSFFVTYANLDEPTLSLDGVKAENLQDIDRWLLSRLQTLILEVTGTLEGYMAAPATYAIEKFIDEMSNWYVRRNRRRFWKSENDADKNAAYQTLYTTLVTLVKLIAPILPFSAEDIYQNLVRSIFPDAPESVHHCDYPQADRSLIDETLMKNTDLIMKLVSLGHSARNATQIKVRQPLSRLFVVTRERSEERSVERFRRELLEELNIKELTLVGDASELVTYQVRPKFNLLGPKYGRLMPRIQQTLASADTKEIVRNVKAGEEISLEVDGSTITIAPDEVTVETVTREGLIVAEEAGYVVAIDTTLTEGLIQEGVVRDLVRHIQSMRKEADLNVDDKIVTTYKTDGKLKLAIERYREYIQQETLTAELKLGEDEDGFS